MIASNNAAVAWSISPSVGSIDANTGLYTAPATITTSQAVTVTATSQANGTSAGTATVSLNAPGSRATAQFVKFDTTTQGNWKGVYGADGYGVINNTISYPGYVTPAPSGNFSYTWPATSDVRALQQATSGGLIAAVWYAATSFTIDLPFTGSQVHQMAVYCLDFDGLGRAQRMDILDTNNNLLDSRSLTNMTNGVWVVGQTGASYIFTVSNGGAGPTNGTVMVTDTLPSGLTATGISGSGWSCSQPAGPCIRSDVRAVGSSYPILTLTVTVASNAPSSVTNMATVSGGGETNTANDTASGPTTVE